MSERKLYSRFDRPDRCGIHFSQPSKTEQSCFEDVNIHSIRARGMNHLPPNTMKPLYGVNLNDVGDLQHSLTVESTYKSSFENLPLDVKEFFHNNVHELTAFLSDKEKNYAKGVELGLFSSPDSKPTVFEQSVSKISEFYSDGTNKTVSKPTPEVIPRSSE